MSSEGGLPDQVLESFTLGDALPTDRDNGLVTIDSITHPELLAGQEYWIVAAGGPTTYASWQQNVHGIVDLSPFLTQAVKTQNPFKGELSHGVVEKDIQ
jgi:hypothetical protein